MPPQVDGAEKLVKSAAEQGVNLRLLDSGSVTISLDETTTLPDVDQLLSVLNGGKAAGFSAESLAESVRLAVLCFTSPAPAVHRYPVDFHCHSMHPVTLHVPCCVVQEAAACCSSCTSFTSAGNCAGG